MDIKSKIAYYRQHAFVKNVLLLQSGSFAGNIIQALVGVFMARLLQPELFGVYALAFSLAGLIGLFQGVGAQEAMATVLGETYARKDTERTKEALAFLLKIISITSAIAVAGALMAPWIAGKLYQNPHIGSYSAIIIVAVVFSTTFFSLSSLVLQVAGRIKAMMVLSLTDQMVRYGLSVGFVFLGLGIWGAVSGHLAGAIIVFIISLVIWERLRRQYPIFPSLRKLFKQAKTVSLKKYLGFSLWIAVDRNVASLYGILPVVLTGIYVSSTEVTFFKLALAFVNLALSLLGPVSTLLNVEFPKMKVEEASQLGKNFVRVSVYSLVLSMILTGAALLFAPLAFRFFYGESFMMSIKYVYGLFLYGALFGVGVGLGPMWRAVNKVKTSILINSITLGAGIPLGLWLIKNHGLWGAVIMVTVWYSVSHFVSFFYLARLLNSRQRHAY
ncbi:MAG: oligosaccharide flippase family protein [bacterium]|nr:oligosaccharide flippase family protein [bacterium]